METSHTWKDVQDADDFETETRGEDEGAVRAKQSHTGCRSLAGSDKFLSVPSESYSLPCGVPRGTRFLLSAVSGSFQLQFESQTILVQMAAEPRSVFTEEVY